MSLLLGFGLAIFGDNVAQSPTADSNTFANSAVGHKAFLRLLRELNIPVVVSQYETENKAENSLVVLLEPNIHTESESAASEMVGSAAGVLLVLPKWHGTASPDDPTRIESAVLLPEDGVLKAMSVFDDNAQLVRTSSSSSLISSADFAGKPDIQDLQLVESEWLEPMIWNDDGILVGRHVVDHFWVLSDPDLLSNHGLDNGDNAALAIQLIEAARGESSIVIDETLHGFVRQPSLYRTLFEFPLILVTFQVLLTVVLLLWSSTGRFGKPIPRPPKIAPGKGFLVDNTASLLMFGGHTAHGLCRYRDVTVDMVARQLHATPGLSEQERAIWLDRVGRARGARESLREINAEVQEIAQEKRPDGRSVLKVANRLYRWRQEMTDGFAGS
jgi:hypothetical protein